MKTNETQCSGCGTWMEDNSHILCWRCEQEASDARQHKIQRRIFRGEIEATDADGVQTMSDFDRPWAVGLRSLMLKKLCEQGPMTAAEIIIRELKTDQKALIFLRDRYFCWTILENSDDAVANFINSRYMQMVRSCQQLIDNIQGNAFCPVI
jgi:hypothetical protein